MKARIVVSCGFFALALIFINVTSLYGDCPDGTQYCYAPGKGERLYVCVSANQRCCTTSSSDSRRVAWACPISQVCLQPNQCGIPCESQTCLAGSQKCNNNQCQNVECYSQEDCKNNAQGKRQCCNGFCKVCCENNFGCPSGTTCLSELACCAPGATLCNGKCCSEGKKCCGIGSNAICSECCVDLDCHTGETCIGGNCCLSTLVCPGVKGNCCPSGTACALPGTANAMCCAGTFCSNSTSIPSIEGICCPNGTTCNLGGTANAMCCAGIFCATSRTAGICCPLGTQCSGSGQAATCVTSTQAVKQVVPLQSQNNSSAQNSPLEEAQPTSSPPILKLETAPLEDQPMSKIQVAPNKLQPSLPGGEAQPESTLSPALPPVPQPIPTNPPMVEEEPPTRSNKKKFSPSAGVFPTGNEPLERRASKIVQTYRMVFNW